MVEMVKPVLSHHSVWLVVVPIANIDLFDENGQEQYSNGTSQMVGHARRQPMDKGEAKHLKHRNGQEQHLRNDIVRVIEYEQKDHDVEQQGSAQESQQTVAKFKAE